MNRVRVGVLGTGTIVQDFHLPALLENPRAQVVAIGNLRAPSAIRLAKQFDVEKVYTEIEPMADDRQIDAVIVALPNYLHARATQAMLQAGKHVLCEKPMAMTVLEGRGMVHAAKAAGRKLMIAHVWRVSPQVAWLRDVLDSGRLGRIERVKAHAIVAGRGPQPGSWAVRTESAGGGALADVGIHSIDTVSFLFHDRINPARITARVSNDFRDLAVEDTAHVRIEYDNGMIAEVDAGWFHDLAASPHGAVELFGTKGYGRTLPTRWRAEPDGPWHEFDQSLHPDNDRSVYDAQIEHFLDCILNDRSPVCDGNQGLRDMIVLETAYESARSNSTIDLPPHLKNVATAPSESPVP